MKREYCEDIKRRISPYALGELDSEEARLIKEHLEGCSECKQNYNSVAAAISSIKELPQIPSSSQRREDVKNIMNQEYMKKFDRVSRPGTIRLTLLAATAAVAIFTVIYLVVRTPQGSLSAKVISLSGQGHFREANQSEWKKINEGQIIGFPADIRTTEDSVMKLQVYGVEPEADIYLSQTCNVRLAGKERSRRIELSDGEIYMELSTDDRVRYTVFDQEDNTLVCSGSVAVEVSLKRMFVWSTPAAIKQELKRPDFTIGLDDVPLSQTCVQISKKAGRNIEPANKIIGDKKVVFYTNKNTPEQIWSDFEHQMKRQDLVIVQTQEGYKVNSVTSSDRPKKLFCRSMKGQVTLNGKTIAGGSEAFVDPIGEVAMLSFDSPHIAQWRFEGYYKAMARSKMTLVPIVFAFKGMKDGKPTFEILIPNTDITGEMFTVSIPEFKRIVGHEEVTVPFTFKIKPK